MHFAYLLEPVLDSNSNAVLFHKYILYILYSHMKDMKTCHKNSYILTKPVGTLENAVQSLTDSAAHPCVW